MARFGHPETNDMASLNFGNKQCANKSTIDWTALGCREKLANKGKMGDQP
jgi:hypothetical protein